MTYGLPSKSLTNDILYTCINQNDTLVHLDVKLMPLAPYFNCSTVFVFFCSDPVVGIEIRKSFYFNMEIGQRQKKQPKTFLDVYESDKD